MLLEAPLGEQPTLRLTDCRGLGLILLSPWFPVYSPLFLSNNGKEFQKSLLGSVMVSKYIMHNSAFVDVNYVKCYCAFII